MREWSLPVLKWCVVLTLVLIGGAVTCGDDASATATDAAAHGDAVDTLSTGGRSVYVHRITLYDRKGVAIDPEARNAEPYATAMTCGKCHDVGQIGTGRHFGAMTGHGEAGRPGEPWFLIDHLTGTQLPLSYRGWRDTWRPRDVNVSTWQFVNRFGRHFPGALDSSYEVIDADTTDAEARWKQSGRLEIDCMVCHTADRTYDFEDRADQLGKENYRWAPMVAAGFGVVNGAASRMAEADDADMFDPLAAAKEPSLPMQYDARRFDLRGRAVMDITGKPSADQCYYCHTTGEAAPTAPPEWHVDGDVHLRAGMTCVDCHRHGIDHMMVRGYRGEPLAASSAQVKTLSCTGCHLGDETAKEAELAQGGRLGAPRPLHRGLPPVHFEKLTCTACHAGPWPGEATLGVQTSLAHGLGLASRERQASDRPHVEAPVFLRQAHDGRIAPHRMTWPAFFGKVGGDGAIRPLPLAQVQAAARATPRGRQKHLDGAPLTDEQIIAILSQLAATGDRCVYVAQGFAHRLDAGELVRETHEGARPYAWAMGHDVRPASQSLGVRGCTDCHGKNAPMYFARVGGVSGRLQPVAQYELLGAERAELTRWAWSYELRDVFKFAAIGGFAVLLVIVVAHGLLGVRGVAAGLGTVRGPRADTQWSEVVRRRFTRRWLERFAGVILLVGTLGGAATAGWPILRDGIGSLSGNMLWLHVAIAPAFLVGLLVVVLLRSHDNAFATGSGQRYSGGQKALFWLMASTGVVTVGAILACMTTVFAADSHVWLVAVHRWSSAAFVVLWLLYGLSLLAGRRVE